MPMSSSVASNMSARRLGRQAARTSRNRLSINEVQASIASRPELAARIAQVRQNPALDEQQRIEEIAHLLQAQSAGTSTATPSLPTPPISNGAGPSDIERRQAAFSPTPEQKACMRAATEEQNARAAAAEAKRIFEPVGRTWHEFGGEALASMLECVTLVDARYLISLHEKGGILPKCQNLPPSARIDASNVWRLYGWERMFSLGVLVLSYPWLDFEHPDRQGEHLGRLVPVLRRMLPFAGGDQFTVGVLWDYAVRTRRRLLAPSLAALPAPWHSLAGSSSCARAHTASAERCSPAQSLPQPPRSAQEAATFAGGLRSLMAWFAHPYTHVLLLSGPLPTGASYSNDRPYASRAWCEAEQRTCAISKCVHCLWDLRGLDLHALEGLGGMQAFDALRSQLKSGRLPPMAPPAFAKRLRHGVSSGELAFSEGGDLEAVIEMCNASTGLEPA